MAAAVATFDPTNTRCAFEYTVPQNANEDRKRKAIAEEPGGDVRIAQDHELVTALGHLLPAPAGGKVAITMHLVEFLVMSLVIFHQDLDTMAPNWFIKLSWLSALWAAMMNAGMESGRAEHPQELRSRIHSTMQALPDTDRTLRTADVIVNSKPTGTWWEHISPRRLRAGDAFNTVFSQLRNMVTATGGKTHTRRTHFKVPWTSWSQPPSLSAPQQHKQPELLHT